MLNLQINQILSTPKGKLSKGAKIKILTDENMIPLDIFWRNRLKDSAIDNCVEIVEEESSKKEIKESNNKTQSKNK